MIVLDISASLLEICRKMIHGRPVVDRAARLRSLPVPLSADQIAALAPDAKAAAPRLWASDKGIVGARQS
jgi:hypothetical protein